MKKVIQINTVCNASTGRIMGDIQREAIKQGYETLSFVGRRKPFSDIPCEKIGNVVSFWIHVAVNTVIDRQGYASYFVTKKLIRRLREEKPDIIHLHNLHGYYLHLPLLFQYMKEEFDGKLFWTFHDCWPFTGHCSHFTARECDRWKKGCYNCPNKKMYPISLGVDASKRNYIDKKNLFSRLRNLTIITPSEWMSRLVKESFLQQYPVEIVNNGIDLSVFSYKEGKADIYRKYKICEKKKILLGVASIWNKGKGLDDFIMLSQVITDDYQIVLVGLTKSQIRKLPANIIGIPRTQNVEELVKIYSTAHIFINPSLEESFSLVTAEALACGTPVIVLDTSAVKELVCNNNGVVLSKHSNEEYLRAIKQIEERNISREQICRTAQKYDNSVFVKKIVKLYE